MLQAVAHEVKNLLAELALRVQAHDPYAAALAHSAANKLAQALLLSNVEQITPQIEAASPQELLDDLVAQYGPLFPHKSLKINAGGAPMLWYYDAHLMRLALSNVVHNALQHCTTAVELHCYERGGHLRFDVRDDGDGFSSEFLAMTATAHAGQSQAPYGTGIGLAITRRIVHAHILKKQNVMHGALELRNDGGAVASLIIP